MLLFKREEATTSRDWSSPRSWHRNVELRMEIVIFAAYDLVGVYGILVRDRGSPHASYPTNVILKHEVAVIM